jgi:hypothetical protein
VAVSCWDSRRVDFSVPSCIDLVLFRDIGGPSEIKAANGMPQFAAAFRYKSSGQIFKIV